MCIGIGKLETDVLLYSKMKSLGDMFTGLIAGLVSKMNAVPLRKPAIHMMDDAFYVQGLELHPL